ncbi:LPXTG cell wall anchor domain-containing protein [Allosalinactinospora lopnorensis]|uniref:LPXTG cell wall anchor domain-containing protein n=1 Tax=Allosalinactinospora lopnorensis TaxID=1352348 RepID=UPI0012E2FFBC|nr:LPXTG cell wall anchor domain-containing protein [Allosalinactinospora lopnorensis]
MSTRLIPRTAITSLLLGGVTVFAFGLAPAALASPPEGPQEVLPATEPPSPDPDDPNPPEGSGEDEEDDGDEEHEGDEGEHEGDEGEQDGGEDAGDLPSEDCEWVHTPFGKVWICDGEEPEAPEGCDYLLDLNGEWVLECPDDTPPPPEDCDYLLDLNGEWVLECPDETTPDPCEEPGDGAERDECEETPENTPVPRDSDTSSLPLTGSAAALPLAALGVLFVLGGGWALLVAWRNKRAADSAEDTALPAVE